MEEKKQALDLIQSRVKYYLLDWKDLNMDEYVMLFGEKRLRDLTMTQLYHLFSYVTTKDGVSLSRKFE